MQPPRVDVLLVVDPLPAPHILTARAGRVVRIPAGHASPSLIAELRGSIPRLVGVCGDPTQTIEIAHELRRAGLPTVLFADGPILAPEGVEVFPVTDPGAPMDASDSVLDLIGNTPLVRLDRIGRDLPCHLLAKLEYLNPGGSVKDRPAIEMIDAAEKEGLLRRGSTIVEPTSGNTGVALAMVAAQRGYHCIFTMPDKIAEEKRQLLRAFGAKVVICPTAVSPEHPESYYSVANQITASTPGAFQPNQYHNPQNPRAHETLHRTRDLATDRRADHPLRGRCRHGRDDQWGRAVSQSAESSGADHCRRSARIDLLGWRRSAVSRRRDR